MEGQPAVKTKSSYLNAENGPVPSGEVPPEGGEPAHADGSPVEQDLGLLRQAREHAQQVEGDQQGHDRADERPSGKP